MTVLIALALMAIGVGVALIRNRLAEWNNRHLPGTRARPVAFLLLGGLFVGSAIILFVAALAERSA